MSSSFLLLNVKPRGSLRAVCLILTLMYTVLCRMFPVPGRAPADGRPHRALIGISPSPVFRGPGALPGSIIVTAVFHRSPAVPRGMRPSGVFRMSGSARGCCLPVFRRSGNVSAKGFIQFSSEASSSSLFISSRTPFYKNDFRRSAPDSLNHRNRAPSRFDIIPYVLPELIMRNEVLHNFLWVQEKILGIERYLI